MLKFRRFLLLSLFFASCSIIGDDDITDPDAIAKFVSADISGEGQEGYSALGTAQFQSDAQNRIMSITWSGLKTDGEFRFRSGALLPTAAMQGTGFLTEPSNASVTTTVDGYDANGNISGITNSVGSNVFESYDFEYDTQNRLIEITTIYGDPTSACLLNSTDCAGTAIKLRDTLVYFGDKIEYIKRQVYSGDPVSQMAIYLGYGRQPGSFNFSGTDNDIGAFAIKEFANRTGIPDPEANIFATDQFSTSNRYAYFQNELGNWYGGPEDFSDPGGIFPFIGNIDVRLGLRGKILASIELTDIRVYNDGTFQNENGGRSDYRNRLPDYYYFHPFWLFPNLFENGTQLASLYFSDWWIVNQETSLTFQFSQNRAYKLNYALSR